jgi:hypothetical protein
MNEHEALTVLDRRMAEASAELRRAVDDALGDSSSVPASTAATRPERDGAGSSPAINLDLAAAPSRRHRRWVLAAAAAVIAIAGVAGLVLVNGSRDKTAPPANTGPQPFLTPGWLPPGWGPKSAVRGNASAGQPSTATVYGLSTAEDPWTGDVVLVVQIDRGGTTVAAGSDTIDVAGHAGTISRDGANLTVTVPVGDRTFTITGLGVDRDAVLRVAAAAVDGQPIEPVLPPGLVEVASGSIDFAGQPPAGGLALVYGADSSTHSVTIMQRPGRASEIGLLRLVLPAPNTTTDVEVHGQRGMLLEGADVPSVVQWVEAPDLLVTVWADGLGGEELMRLAEAMDPATDAEIDDLVSKYHESPVVTDDLAEGEIVVASGDRGSSHWRVTAREDNGSVDVSYADGSSGFGFAVAPGPGQDSAPELGITTSDTVNERGERVLVGVADPTIARVVVEAVGQPRFPVEVYRRDELPGTVIVGFVPHAYDGGDVVGLDANGHEVARTPLEQ